MKEFKIELPNDSKLTDQELAAEAAKVFHALGRFFEEKAKLKETKINKTSISSDSLNVKVIVKKQGEVTK